MTRKLILATLAICLAAGLVSAQSIGNASPTNSVTSGLIKQDKDNYLSMFDWNKVKDALFFFRFEPSTIGSGANLNDYMQLGFAAEWLPGIYLGTSYQFLNYIDGLVGSADVVQSVDVVPIVDGGTYIGTRSTTSNQVGHRDYSYQNPSILAGFKIGSMDIAAKIRAVLTNDVTTGTLAADGAFTNTANTEVVTTIAGVITDQTLTTVPASGYDRSNTLALELNGSAQLGLLGGNTKADLGLAYYAYDNTRRGAKTVVNTVAGQGFAAYTTIADVKSSVAETRLDTSSNYSYLNGELNTLYEKEVNFFGRAATVSAGLNDSFDFYLYPIGVTNAYDKTDYSANVLASGFVQTTLVTTASNDETISASEMRNSVSIPLKLVVPASKRVTFSLGYDATVVNYSYSEEYTQDMEVVTVVEDGDGVVAASDADDTTTTTTTTYKNSHYTSGRLEFSHNLKAALAFQVIPDFLTFNFGTKTSATPIYIQESRDWETGTETTVTQVLRAGATETTSSSLDAVPGAINRTVNQYGSTSLTVASEFGLSFKIDSALTIDMLATVPNVLNLLNTTATGGAFDLRNYTIEATIHLPSDAGN